MLNELINKTQFSMVKDCTIMIFSTPDSYIVSCINIWYTPSIFVIKVLLCQMFSFKLDLTFLTNLGLSKVSLVCNVVFVLLSISLCTGDPSSLSRGVFL